MLVDKGARVWAMRPDEMMIAAAVRQREAHMEGNGAPMSLGHGEQLEGSDFARVQDGVAIIPARGMLMRSFSYWFWSYDEILRDLALAQDSRAVEQIVIDFDTPGGMVAGCADAGRAIRDSGPKPVTGFVGGMCASAGYWLASACDRIVLGSGTMVGSIGTVIEYIDMEPMLEALGARVIRVVAEQSPNKRLDPGSPEGQAEMQALVDAGGAEFVAAVAEFRGVSEETVMSDFGQGLVFNGAEAIRRGMADGTGTLNTLIAELAGRDEFPAVPAPAAKETPMEWENLTQAALQEHRADLVEKIGEAAVAAAKPSETAITTAVDEALAAERTRVAEIDELAMEGHDELIAKAKAEGWSAEKAALEIVKAEKAAGGKTLAGLEAADGTAAVTPLPKAETPPQKPAASGTPEEQAAAAWEDDEKLRAEFGGNKDAWMAYAKANAAGLAKILNRAAA
ncbi:hypothetical protein FHY55_19430 [Oceanicola sp. D3]|uniref:S49 family peptidase n=1 Tax=Oceanicola sp. D3 TaxID=2587163 RepID=UPI001124BA06|nr:S49 family peptidase [Oceanicola sp. D3]QDC11271.1 hypothetical protein FHY55_19430 [Oceanicola sp. D3]